MDAQATNSQPVNCDQLLRWIDASIPEQRIGRLVEERGLTFQLDNHTARSLRTAGATSALIRTLRLLDTKREPSRCAVPLVQIGQLVRQEKFDQAERSLRTLLAADPKNAELHFALGYVRQQQNDDDQAFDEYFEAKQLRPGFPEIHNGLALNFYRSNDGEDAIAEARTALSIDPRNAEGYRYLGLGLMISDKYAAAVHAFKESLLRDDNNAETYNNMALAQSKRGDLAAAASCYRKALHLNPRLREVRNVAANDGQIR
jgi:Flp pilus assembly protein TadD